MNKQHKADAVPAKAQHTLGELSVLDSSQGFDIVDSHGDLVATVPVDGTGHERDYAVALVRHHNSNEELLAALKACEKAIGDAQEMMSADEIDEHWQDQNLRDAAIKARAAITKAERSAQ